MNVRELVRGTIISIAVAAGVFAAFVAAALWVPQDQPTIRRHLAAAVADGTFNARFGYGPFGGLVWPRHTMDCGISSMMLAPPAGRLADAISNRMAAVNPSWNDPRVAPTLDCQAFARAVAEMADVTFTSNDRYIMGIRVFGRAMLSVWPLDVTAKILRGIAFALLAILGAIALWKLHRADAATRLLPAGYAVMTVCLTLLYGVHFFDATLVFAPPDFVHFIFFIISLLAPLARMRPGTLALYAASYGSLTAIFDALTGNIPTALAILPLLLALGFNGDRRTYLIKIVAIWFYFSVAVIASLVIKKVVSVALFTENDSFFALLLFRMYGSVPAETGVDLSLGYLLWAYRRWSGLIALGSANIGTGLILGSLALFAVQSWRMRKTPWSPETAILIAGWLSVGALIAWAAVFLNHTAVHPYHMARVLIIPVIGAAVLATALLLRRRETGRAASSTQLSPGA